MSSIEINEDIMKKTLLLSVLMAFSTTLFGQVTNFDKDEPGQAPKGFSFGLTGKGKPGVWIVRQDVTAPSAPDVLAQTDADPVSYRFPYERPRRTSTSPGARTACCSLELSNLFLAVPARAEQKTEIRVFRVK
jgi:hypothetical protein